MAVNNEWREERWIERTRAGAIAMRKDAPSQASRSPFEKPSPIIRELIVNCVISVVWNGLYVWARIQKARILYQRPGRIAFSKTSSSSSPSRPCNPKQNEHCAHFISFHTGALGPPIAPSETQHLLLPPASLLAGREVEDERCIQRLVAVIAHAGVHEHCLPVCCHSIPVTRA